MKIVSLKGTAGSRGIVKVVRIVGVGKVSEGGREKWGYIVGVVRVVEVVGVEVYSEGKVLGVQGYWVSRGSEIYSRSSEDTEVVEVVR